MKKAALVTWYYGNYGSVLQAFALQKAVEELGYECFVLNASADASLLEKIKFKIRHHGLISFLGFLITFALSKFRAKKLSCYTDKREKALNGFIEKNIRLSAKKYNESRYSDSVSDFDIFICGSDQIWNPELTYYSDFYWLGFVDKNKTKIAYAPSMGSASANKDDIKIIKNYLLDFRAVSVREEKSKKFFEKITEKPVEFVLDPTLLHSKDFWDKICVERKTEEKYLFAYLLRANESQLEFTKKAAESLGLKLVFYPVLEAQYAGKDQLGFGDIRVYDDDPADFISRIKYADFIITDSFHCSVFSIMYHKDFCVLRKSKDKTSQFSRLDGLLKMCGQTGRIADENKPFIKKDISYSGVDKILYKKRAESLEFLKNALLGGQNDRCN